MFELPLEPPERKERPERDEDELYQELADERHEREIERRRIGNESS